MRLGTAATLGVGVLALALPAAIRQGEAARPATRARHGVTAEITLDPFLLRGVQWLVEAQHGNGGWGAGSHAKQHLRDPHHVATDPATTAFVAMALVRSGSTP